MSRDLATLADMLLAARTIQELVAGMEQARFIEDVRTRSAVAYQLGIVGESVRRLSEEFRGAHPQVPWRRITGMRNWLMHQYDAVDWERDKFVPDLLSFARRWDAAPQAWAFLPVGEAERLPRELGIRMQVMARGPQYAIVKKP